MTAIVTGHDGRPYIHSAASGEAVFVAEQVRMGSACGTPHTGFATLLGWLDPMRDGETLARVRLPGGAIIDVRASAVCPAQGVAARRLGPRPLVARASA